MGEGGENNPGWLATVFQLYEDLDIGWCFWPWKKIGTATSPCSIDAPPGWSAIVDHANGRGPRPSPEEAKATLDELVARSAIDRCTYRPEVVNALFRRVPLELPATAFGFTGEGTAYVAKEPVPLVGFRSDDGVTIELGPSGELPPFDNDDGSRDEALVVRLRPGDWVAYDVETLRAGDLEVEVTVTDLAEGPPCLAVDDVELDVDRAAGGWLGTMRGVRPGRHALRVEAGPGGLGLVSLFVRPALMAPGGAAHGS